MLKHHSVKADSMADAEPVSKKQSTAEARPDLVAAESQLFHLLSRKHDVAPVAYMPRALEVNPRSQNLRRILTREQGRALEIIGHAVDYLNDCYIYEGNDDELINIGGTSGEAIRILACLRSEILQSAPVREARMSRIWNALFHRQNQDRPGVVFHRASDHATQSKPASVLPLSSSR